MNAPIRPRRSVLYMPGANARALDKARTLDADVLILDLEDAVAPDAKAQARAQVAAALREGGYGRRECIVRVNALDTPWGLDDVRAIAQAGADAVLLPKVETPAQLAALAQALDAAGAPADLPLWAMAETPLGFLRLDAIAGGHARLAAIVVGTSDLVKDLHARHTPSRNETLLARSLAVMAARAHGLAVLDGVHLDLNDDAGLQDTCRQGRDQGFDGKTLIHPRQIAAANAAFAPTLEELDTARKRLDAWKAAQAEGKGVAVVDGALVENLHASEAERVLALAAAIQAT
ncbi:HpcH/HpaI aldolase/citrate lyase family protein [Achromobacter spanius]|uniref:CoA ester lyase n=1 Tax=Achromobacter spanius TaxID=217203 RepID=A0A2S0I7L8_9BURK|nr:CoA ester lyase [Achromobacter spanius]AVJ28040.1 CoA ester lyase [Achromobacter spanius]